MLTTKFEFDFSDDKLISKLIELYNNCSDKEEIINIDLKGHELQAILINLIPGRTSYKLCMDYFAPEIMNKQNSKGGNYHDY